MSFARLPRVVFSVGWAVLLGSLAVSAHAQLAIEWVTVGDPGNAADTIGAGYGAVATDFRIMKYEFTNQQGGQVTVPASQAGLTRTSQRDESASGGELTGITP